ncbi:hypothetical protein J6590_051205 [Homalodisca vitripennis]|nr:hypothetical protein J6590_051205 [Homalodisca vitripennis]
MNGTNYNQLHDIDGCHSQTKTDDDRKPLHDIDGCHSQTKTDDDRMPVTRISPSLSTPYTA